MKNEIIVYRPTQYQSPSSILPQREEVVPSLKRNQWRKLFPFRQLTEITRGEKTFGEPVEPWFAFSKLDKQMVTGILQLAQG